MAITGTRTACHKRFGSPNDARAYARPCDDFSCKVSSRTRTGRDDDGATSRDVMTIRVFGVRAGPWNHMIPGKGQWRGSVAIQIRMSGPGADTALSSLYAWLRDEPDVRQRAQISLLAAESGPADMGAVFDVIQLVVDDGFQAMNLALAYAAWRATRPRQPHVTIEYDGITVTLNGSDSETVEAIVHLLE